MSSSRVLHAGDANLPKGNPIFKVDCSPVPSGACLFCILLRVSGFSPESSQTEEAVINMFIHSATVYRLL